MSGLMTMGSGGRGQEGERDLRRSRQRREDPCWNIC